MEGFKKFLIESKEVDGDLIFNLKKILSILYNIKPSENNADRIDGYLQDIDDLAEKYRLHDKYPRIFRTDFNTDDQSSSNLSLYDKYIDGLDDFTDSFDELDESTSTQKDIDPDKKVIAKGVKGMKSTPFSKKFPNLKSFENWSDSEEAGDYDVQEVINESTTTDAEETLKKQAAGKNWKKVTTTWRPPPRQASAAPDTMGSQSSAPVVAEDDEDKIDGFKKFVAESYNHVQLAKNIIKKYNYGIAGVEETPTHINLLFPLSVEDLEASKTKALQIAKEITDQIDHEDVEVFTYASRIKVSILV